MADPYRITSDWQEGYDAGYQAGLNQGRAPARTLSQPELRKRYLQGRKKLKTKRSRKPSKYNLFMKKELKRLRKKHPRTKQQVLFKRAAKSWRRHR